MVELAAAVHFLEEAHDHLRTILQVDPFMEDLLAGRHSMVVDSLATLLQEAVMDIMEAGTTDIILTVSEAGMRRGMAMVHMLVLSGAG